MRWTVMAMLAALMASPTAGAGYDKTETTELYQVRLRVPEQAMAIAPLKVDIFTRWKKNVAGLKSDATTDHEGPPQYFHRYVLDTNWRVTFEDAKVISLSGDSFIDENGAHPNAYFDSMVWDKSAGRVVPFAALFAEGKAAAAFKAIAASARKTWVATVNKESGSDPIDPAMADEGIGNDGDHLGHYVFTYAKGETKANGIVLLFGAGEYWAHVMGEFRLAVPLSVFRQYLAPQWAAEFK